MPRQISDVIPRKAACRVSCKILLLVLAISIIMAGSSATTYNEWVLSSTTTVMGNYSVYARVYPDWEAAGVTISEEEFFLTKGECESTLNFRICFNETRFDLSKDWGRMDYSRDRKIPEMQIILEEYIPQLSFVQKSDKAELYVDEETIIRVEISVPRGLPLENISFRQEIPDSITITDPEDAKYIDGVISWEYPYLQGDKSFVYKLRINRPANVTLNASLSGVYLDGTNLSKSGKLVLKTLQDPNPLTQKGAVSASQPSLGNIVTYTLTLTNADSNDNTVSGLIIILPASSMPVRWDNRLERYGFRFIWNGTVTKGRQEDFSITFSQQRTGKHNITSELSNSFYDIPQAKYLQSKNTHVSRFEVKFKQLTPHISFMFDKKQVNASEQSNVRVAVSNQNSDTIIYDVNATLVTDLFGTYTMVVERMAPGENVSLFYIPFTAPSFPEDTKLNVALNGTYKTQFGESFSFIGTDSMLIKKDPNYRNVSTSLINQTHTQNQNQTAGQQAGAANTTTSSGGQQATSASATNSGDAKQENIFARIANWLNRLFGWK